jgi:hypothetical protein
VQYEARKGLTEVLSDIVIIRPAVSFTCFKLGFKACALFLLVIGANTAINDCVQVTLHDA